MDCGNITLAPGVILKIFPTQHHKMKRMAPCNGGVGRVWMGTAYHVDLPVQPPRSVATRALAEPARPRGSRARRWARILLLNAAALLARGDEVVAKELGREGDALARPQLFHRSAGGHGQRNEHAGVDLVAVGTPKLLDLV